MSKIFKLTLDIIIVNVIRLIYNLIFPVLSEHTFVTFYYKSDLLLADTGTTNLLKPSDAVALSKSDVHELVSIYDKENASYKIYLDNALVKETTELVGAGIKACTYVGNNQTDGNFIGKLYELSLYNKALTAEEIASLQ